MEPLHTLATRAARSAASCFKMEMLKVLVLGLLDVAPVAASGEGLMAEGFLLALKIKGVNYNWALTEGKKERKDNPFSHLGFFSEHVPFSHLDTYGTT